MHLIYWKDYSVLLKYLSQLYELTQLSSYFPSILSRTSHFPNASPHGPPALSLLGPQLLPHLSYCSPHSPTSASCRLAGDLRRANRTRILHMTKWGIGVILYYSA